jgi:hypothetical protein
VTTPQASAYTDHSIASATGASQVLFAAKAFAEVGERFVHNPNAAGDIWVNPFGNAAVANGAGSIRLQPGQTLTLTNTNEVRIIAAAAAKVTAGQR